MAEEQKKAVGRCVDHLANERTFLAWIRTSIGIMAFGFVVEKFNLFLKQITQILGKIAVPTALPAHPQIQGVSATFGIFLVGLGALIGLCAFFRFKKVEREIEEGRFVTSSMLAFLLTLAILYSGIFLIVYLVISV